MDEGTRTRGLIKVWFDTRIYRKITHDCDFRGSRREISYQNTLDQNSNSSYNMERREEALERLSFKDPYHTATFQLGLRYSLGKK